MISIVIPARDEEAALGEVIEAVHAALDDAHIEHEVIVIDDGSNDRTGEVARSSGARVVSHPAAGGYGRSVKDGIIAAQYEVIGLIDADGTYPATALPELYRLVADRGFDMAVGARTGKQYRGSFPKMPARRVFRWLTEYATGTRVDDVNSGLRVMRRELPLLYAHTVSNGFSFTTTITLAAMLNGYFVTYTPIEYNRRVGESHVRHVRDSLRSLQIIVENILYYNPLKLFLLLCQMLGLLACLGVAAFVGLEGRVALLGALTAIISIVGALVVAAIGFSAMLSGAEMRARFNREARLAERVLQGEKHTTDLASSPTPTEKARRG